MFPAHHASANLQSMRGCLPILLCCSVLSACFRPDGHSQASPDAGNPAGGSGGFDDGSSAFDASGGFDGSQGTPTFCSDGTVCPALDPSTMAGQFLEPCCTPSGSCSLRTVGTECTELSEPEAGCGTVSTGFGELPGCCLDGLCGLRLAMFGLDCVSRAELAAAGLPIDLQVCLAVDAGTHVEAGANIEDAGF